MFFSLGTPLGTPPTGFCLASLLRIRPAIDCEYSQRPARVTVWRELPANGPGAASRGRVVPVAAGYPDGVPKSRPPRHTKSPRSTSAGPINSGWRGGTAGPLCG